MDFNKNGLCLYPLNFLFLLNFCDVQGDTWHHRHISSWGSSFWFQISRDAAHWRLPFWEMMSAKWLQLRWKPLKAVPWVISQVEEGSKVSLCSNSTFWLLPDPPLLLHSRDLDSMTPVVGFNAPSRMLSIYWTPGLFISNLMALIAGWPDLDPIKINHHVSQSRLHVFTTSRPIIKWSMIFAVDAFSEWPWIIFFKGEFIWCE